MNEPHPSSRHVMHRRPSHRPKELSLSTDELNKASLGHSFTSTEDQRHYLASLKSGTGLAADTANVPIGRATYSFINKGIINTYTGEVMTDGTVNGRAHQQVDGSDVAVVELTPKVAKTFEAFTVADVMEEREKTPGQYAQVHKHITQKTDFHRKTLLDKASTEDTLEKIMSMRAQTSGAEFTPEQMRMALERNPKAVLDWAQAHPQEAQAKLNDPRFASIARQYAAENPNTTISTTFKRLSSSGTQQAMTGMNSGLSPLY